MQIDIEEEMVLLVKKKAEEMALPNIVAIERDFIVQGTGLSNGSVNYAMLFNILHAEKPTRLTDEAYRVLVSGGLVGVIHWRYDPSTPRGPSMKIRPKPEQCRGWLAESGFRIKKREIDLSPYHYGTIGQKP